MNRLKRYRLGLLKKLKFLPQDKYAQIYYEYYHDRKLDLEDPVDFNEKIHWLKVYYHPAILSALVDKYEVRKYVKEKVGEKYLNELLACYNKVSEIDFDKLPDQFVLKTTHGYNNNIIVRDKGSLNRRSARLKLSVWMLKNHYYMGGQEWAYKNVRPRIIAEKYLPQVDSDGATDFKFYCFNGEPEFIEVGIKIQNVVHRSYLDTNWEKTDFYRPGHPVYEEKPVKPQTLEEMLEVSRKLSGEFPFVRVDLYNINGRILFGELTFYPADGRSPFYPPEYNKVLGRKMILPQLPEGKKEITEV